MATALSPGLNATKREVKVKVYWKLIGCACDLTRQFSYPGPECKYKPLEVAGPCQWYP